MTTEHKRRQREGGGNLTRMVCHHDVPLRSWVNGTGQTSSVACTRCQATGEVRGGSGWNRWRRVWVWLWLRGNPGYRRSPVPLVWVDVPPMRHDYNDKAREDRRREAIATRWFVTVPVRMFVPRGLVSAVEEAEAMAMAAASPEARRAVRAVWFPRGVELAVEDLNADDPIVARYFSLDEDAVGTDREATPENVRRFVREALGGDE